MPPVNGHRYLASTAVFLAEVVKLALCASVALYELARSPSPAAATAASLLAGLAARVFRGDSWRLALPAALYTVQHSLQFVAVAHLDAATVQVTSQFKIIPTAVFSILILRRRLNAEQWVALALLLLGVAIVQIPGAAPADGAPPAPAGGLAGLRGLHKRSATYEGIEEDYLREHPTRSSAVGLAAALGAGSASALGSVLLEKVLKESASATGGGGDGRREPVGIWVRNVQLAVYALVPALGVGVGCVDGAAVARHGFLAGYNAVVWTVVACQALGGILVALCVHYADNIAKSFATSISILLSLFASILFFDFALTPYVRFPPPSAPRLCELQSWLTRGTIVPPRHDPRHPRHLPLQQGRRPRQRAAGHPHRRRARRRRRAVLVLRRREGAPAVARVRQRRQRRRSPARPAHQDARHAPARGGPVDVAAGHAAGRPAPHAQGLGAGELL